MNKLKQNCSFFTTIFMLLILITFFSCKTRERRNLKFNYLQNVNDTTLEKLLPIEYLFKINDIISVQVISGTVRQEDAAVYNLPNGISGIKSGISGASGATYTVDSLGFINMPKVGKVKAKGLSKIELAKLIEKKLVEEIVNPIVVVNTMGIKVNVIGEIKKAGSIYFKNERPSIIDALTECGDIEDFGRRDNVLLLREQDNKLVTYRLDLTNAAFINSPAYYLQQNDIIVVSASDMKLKVVNQDPNKYQQLALIATLTSTFVLLLVSTGIIKRN